MSIPKKRKPLLDKNKIHQAIKMADDKPDDKKSKKAVEEKKVQEQKIPEKNKKKVGRPRLAGDRSAKITFFLAQETFERFNLAFPQEQFKRAKNGEKIDKSLIIEDAIKVWLSENGY
jgi:hypothetical protein